MVNSLDFYDPADIGIEPTNNKNKNADSED